MKPTKISYGRTFARNYQSYSAIIDVELEPWETDLDASFDKLRDMVHDQIGKQSDDFKDSDKVTMAPLRAHVSSLERKIFELEQNISRLKSRRSLLCKEVKPLLEFFDDVLQSLSTLDLPQEKYSSLTRIRNMLYDLAHTKFDKQEKLDDEELDDEDCIPM